MTYKSSNMVLIELILRYTKLSR